MYLIIMIWTFIHINFFILFFKKAPYMRKGDYIVSVKLVYTDNLVPFSHVWSMFIE